MNEGPKFEADMVKKLRLEIYLQSYLPSFFKVTDLYSNGVF